MFKVGRIFERRIFPIQILQPLVEPTCFIPYSDPQQIGGRAGILVYLTFSISFLNQN